MKALRLPLFSGWQAGLQQFTNMVSPLIAIVKIRASPRHARVVGSLQQHFNLTVTTAAIDTEPDNSPSIPKFSTLNVIEIRCD